MQASLTDVRCGQGIRYSDAKADANQFPKPSSNISATRPSKRARSREGPPQCAGVHMRVGCTMCCARSARQWAPSPERGSAVGRQGTRGGAVRPVIVGGPHAHTSKGARSLNPFSSRAARGGLSSRHCVQHRLQSQPICNHCACVCGWPHSWQSTRVHTWGHTAPSCRRPPFSSMQGIGATRLCVVQPGRCVQPRPANKRCAVSLAVRMHGW